MERLKAHLRKPLGHGRSLARRFLTSHQFSFSVILAYHRISPLTNDPQLLAIEPRRFEEQIRALMDHFEIVALDDLLVGSNVKDAPNAPRLAITFDDGYADNYRTAAPILRRLGLPATFFITVGQLEGESEFWWDELERVFLEPGALPQRLNLKGGRMGRTWDLGPYREYDADEEVTWRSWDVRQRSRPTSRHAIYADLSFLLTRLGSKERTRLMNVILEWSGLDRIVRESHRIMTRAELKALNEMPGMTIGSHTVTHPFVAALDESDLFKELHESKIQLEQLTGGAICYFAFPYGTHASLGTSSSRALQASGYLGALTTRNAFVRSSTDRLRLPRVLVQTEDLQSLLSSLGCGFSRQ